MASPPGTSPTPVFPSESLRINRFLVKNGPCAPLRLSSMLSRPAIGITINSVTTGVAFCALIGTPFSWTNSCEPLVSVGNRADHPRHLVAHQAQGVDDLPLALRCESRQRDRRADCVLGGMPVTQRDRETLDALRVFLVFGGVSPHPDLVESRVETGTVSERAGCQRRERI